MSEPRCKICDSATQGLTDLQFGIRYHVCPVCDYIFKDESAFISEEETRQIYLQHENTPDNEGYVQMFERFLEYGVDPHARHIRTALDFGCGPGPVLSSLLRDHGFKTEIYDPFFANRADVLSQSYDLITATEVLEHLVHPRVELRRLAKLLNPEGILAVMTLFHPNDPTAFQDWWYRRDPTHVGFFTPKSLQSLANHSGFDLFDHDHQRIAVFRKPSVRRETSHNKMETAAE